MSNRNPSTPPPPAPAPNPPSSAPPTGQAPVPGGLIGTAGVQPGGPVFRTHEPNPTIDGAGRGQSVGGVVVLDGGMIVDRGRGPEIAGTRITIYTIMDFLKYNYSVPEIARELRLTDRQVRAAVDYIRSHQAESDREYGLIMERVNQPNPPKVEQGCARTPEELRQRIRARRERGRADGHPVGQ
jgi:uncharacterized protein (DUF433 family)